MSKLVIDPRTATFSATVSFHRLMGNGKLGKAVDWTLGEGSDWSEVFESARASLRRAGVAEADTLTAMGCSVNQEWDANGALIR